MAQKNYSARPQSVAPGNNFNLETAKGYLAHKTGLDSAEFDIFIDDFVIEQAKELKIATYKHNALYAAYILCLPALSVASVLNAGLYTGVVIGAAMTFCLLKSTRTVITKAAIVKSLKQAVQENKDMYENAPYEDGMTAIIQEAGHILNEQGMNALIAKMESGDLPQLNITVQLNGLIATSSVFDRRKLH